LEAEPASDMSRCQIVSEPREVSEFFVPPSFVQTPGRSKVNICDYINRGWTRHEKFLLISTNDRTIF